MKLLSKMSTLVISALLVFSVSGCGDDSAKDNAKKTSNVVVQKVKNETAKQINQIKPLGKTDFYATAGSLDKCFYKDHDGTKELLQGKTIELFTAAALYSDHTLVLDGKEVSMIAEVSKIGSGEYDKLEKVCSENKKNNFAFVVLKGVVNFRTYANGKTCLVVENTKILKFTQNLLEFSGFMEKQLSDNDKVLKDTHKAIDGNRPQKVNGYGYILNNAGRCILYSNFSKQSNQLAVLKSNTKFTVTHIAKIKKSKYGYDRWYRIKVDNDGKEGWIESDWGDIRIK